MTPPRDRRIRPVGDAALIVDLPDLASAHALARALGPHPVPGQAEVVIGARTVLIRLDPARLGTTPGAEWSDIRRGDASVAGFAPLDDAGDALRAHLAALSVPPTGRVPITDGTVVIDVVYDGADLADVAELTGLAVDDVVRAHTGTPWTVGFTGFAPGFGYLVGGDPRLRVPRRAHPRTTVPAGSVALAGEFSAVYPRASPGGWQLIGRSDARMWDLDRDPPALLRPGTRVRFRALDTTGDRADTVVAGAPKSVQEPPPEGQLRVDDPGARCLVQDLGRPGLAHLGVSGSGAADRGALVRANRLVGNPDDAAALEVTLGGLRVTALRDCVVGMAGAWVPVTLRPAASAGSASGGDAGSGTDGDADSGTGGRPTTTVDPFVAAVDVPAGTQLRLGRPTAGVRSYLAVRGGIDVRPVLGSRSTDTLSGIGPSPVGRGDQLPVGAAPEPRPPVTSGAAAVDDDGGGHTGACAADVTVLDVVLGPRDDWFTDAALATLLDATWTVGRQADRVGIHMEGPTLQRRPGTGTGELPSEGMVPGALQVPASGRPVIFGVDHPVTGGYPVIAVLTTDSCDAAAQLRPGRTVRFRVRDRPVPAS